MKIKLLILLFVSSFAIVSQNKLPNLVLENLKGKRVNIKKYEKSDKIIILSLWATWCGPCLLELDAITKHYQEWQKELDVELVAVSLDDARSKNYVKSLVSGKKWEYTILLDDNQKLKRKLNIIDIPFLAVYYKGKQIFSHQSYTPGYEKELFKELKKVKLNE